MSKDVNYFDYNGMTYYTGTIIWMVDCEIPYISEKLRIKLKFLSYDTEKNFYTFQEMYGETTTYHYRYISQEKFDKYIREIITPVLTSPPPPPDVKKDQWAVDGVLEGWVWYIIIMLFLSITNGAIIGWIVASIIFFAWKKKKVDEYYAGRWR